MNVLITGGAGYIGSHTAKALACTGHAVVAFDNLSTGRRAAVRWCPLVEGDISDRQLLISVMREHAIDSVIHFAASAYVGDSMVSPADYFQNNVVNSLTLLDAMRAAGVDKIVFSSSCATYGIPRRVPVSERAAQSPVNPYGESKRFIERALQWYGEAYGLRWMALRYFNAAGADPAGELGECHEPETHLIPLVIRAALGQSDFVTVAGADYATPDGTAIRDFVHVADLADAHILALEHLMSGGESIALNVGTGQGHSVREVIDAVQRVSRRSVPFRYGGRRAGDPPVLVARTSLCRRILGWTPRYRTLDTIIETAWNWHAAEPARSRLSLSSVSSLGVGTS